MTHIPTARVLQVLHIRRDGAYLIVADCDGCGKTVTHGAGHSSAGLAGFLGHRVPHCACASYELSDPNNVLGTFAEAHHHQK